jgi:hypothetical protein
MVRGILFKDVRFDTRDNNNLMCPMTENTIILCNNYRLMRNLAEEIVNTINGNAEYNDYDCDENDVGQAKYVLNFGLQKVIDVNGQKIILCLEPAMIYRATNIRDIWFADCSGTDNEYQEIVYPMTIFKGIREVWDSGLDKVYEMIIGGRYGCYNGSWTNLR